MGARHLERDTMRANGLDGVTAPRDERFTTPALAGVTLHTQKRGDPSQTALILLHGGGANTHHWDHLAEHLAESFHVISLDFRGHGESDYPETLEVGAFERDLEAVIEHLGAQRPILVGHSMGAHIAIAHAARRGGVGALVALEISRGAPPRERRRTRLALAARRTYRSREEAIRRFRFVPRTRGASESLREQIAAHSVREEPDGRFGFKFDPRWFSLPARPAPPLEQITCPTLIVRGGASSLLSAEGAAELASEIPGARLIEIAGAGHNVHLERPTEVLDAMRGFLANHEGAAPDILAGRRRSP
jgi:pimeloyl-ACP methyl ester carboxylesterase